MLNISHQRNMDLRNILDQRLYDRKPQFWLVIGVFFVFFFSRNYESSTRDNGRGCFKGGRMTESPDIIRTGRGNMKTGSTSVFLNKSIYSWELLDLLDKFVCRYIQEISHLSLWVMLNKSLHLLTNPAYPNKLYCLVWHMVGRAALQVFGLLGGTFRLLDPAWNWKTGSKLQLSTDSGHEVLLPLVDVSLLAYQPVVLQSSCAGIRIIRWTHWLGLASDGPVRRSCCALSRPWK